MYVATWADHDTATALAAALLALARIQVIDQDLTVLREAVDLPGASKPKA